MRTCGASQYVCCSLIVYKATEHPIDEDGSIIINCILRIEECFIMDGQDEKFNNASYFGSLGPSLLVRGFGRPAFEAEMEWVLNTVANEDWIEQSKNL
ncbi:unnamed protein product [Thelazia callipaeda]|uniref:START domain-containing protein n=1 Tax=Thelazia callipaeda TaxID=103827 RepID=A0A0N5DA12_THECL|nr:unnamed protein product [Thelazia callipaeda]